VPEEGAGAVLVTLADGTSLPLSAWSLSYEYLAWKQGTPQSSSSPMRKEGAALWVGRKVIPAAGASLTLKYSERSAESAMGGTRTVKMVKELEMRTPDGKANRLKVEAPHRDLLLPGADGSWLVMPRSLDLKGQTPAGAPKEYCLVSYSTLVECASTPDHQEVKLEFPR
jgi:hypothetical protein